MSILYLSDNIGIDGTVYPTTGEHIRAIGRDKNIQLEDKAPAIIKKETGKTIITNYSSSLPVKRLDGTGKITITGKNILSGKKNVFVPFELKKGTVLTLITNGEVSVGGGVKFTTSNGGEEWIILDKGKTKNTRTISNDVTGITNVLNSKEGLKYCLSIGENDVYEDYKEQVITAPLDSTQLKAIHTYYHTTTLSSENEIYLEYIADTEAYIENKIK